MDWSVRPEGSGGVQKGEKQRTSQSVLKAEVDMIGIHHRGPRWRHQTGGAHVIARLAKASEALTIAVVSYPFV